MEIKPFCVETSKFSKEEIIEIIDLMIEVGAKPYDIVKGQLYPASGDAYMWDEYLFWGYSVGYGTYTYSEEMLFNYNVLNSMEEVYDHLGIKKEKPTMSNKNNTSSKQQPTKQTSKQQKSSNKGQKVLPKSSSLLKFVYNQSEYVVRGVISFNIELENGKLFLKYSYHRKHQSGETSGTDKVLILNDLEKIISLVPSQTHPDKYNHKIVLNLVP